MNTNMHTLPESLMLRLSAILGSTLTKYMQQSDYYYRQKCLTFAECGIVEEVALWTCTCKVRYFTQQAHVAALIILAWICNYEQVELIFIIVILQCVINIKNIIMCAKSI